MKEGYKINHEVLNEKPYFVKLAQFEGVNQIVLFYCTNNSNTGDAIKGVWRIKYK